MSKRTTRRRMRTNLVLSVALAALALVTGTPAPAAAQDSNSAETNLATQNDVTTNVTVPGDNVVADAPPQAAATPASAANVAAVANAKDAPASDVQRTSGDDWGWLKVIVAGLVGAAGVLATQWITARTNRAIAREQAEISRSAVQVAADASRASALGASAAVENAGAARESAAVARRNAENLGVHAVARLRQDWINTVRDELSKLHSLLANYRPLPTKATPEQIITHQQRQRDANQSRAKIALLLNPREVPSRNLAIVIRRMDDPALSIADRARWARWILRWGQILLKEEWDRVRAELKGEKLAAPFRRHRRF